MHNPKKEAGYRPDIDGLRSVAVLLVLVFHFDLVGVGKAGFIGVDVFFVISGFLISSIIWSQLEAQRFSLGGFYLRRFRRLAPAFICVQFLLLACSYFLFLPNDLLALIKQTFFAQTYLINFYFWKSVTYFGLQAHDVLLLHCWSLAVEEQFYLTYPLLLIGVHRYARRFFPAVLIAILVTSFALNMANVVKHPGVTFYLLPCRAWELTLGALLPFAREPFCRYPWVRHAAALFGAVAIAVAVGLYSPHIPFPGYFALLPTLGAAALILAGTDRGSWLSPFLSSRPMVYIGRVSYSLYLVHWPVGLIVRWQVAEYSLFWRWSSLAISFALTSIIFHLVEDPVRRGAVFSTGKRFVVAYATGFATIMLIVASARISGGWRFRYAEDAVRMADHENDRNQEGLLCEYPHSVWGQVDRGCLLGAATTRPDWFVVGDSHAWALAPAFSQFLESKGLGARMTFSHGCMPVLGLGGSKCESFVSDTMARIVDDPGISTVVLVSVWRQVFEGDFLFGPSETPLRGADRVKVFNQNFSQTVQKLHESGKKVIVWESLPPAKQSVPKALAWGRISHRAVDIAIAPQEHERLFRFLSEAIAENRAAIWATVAPAAAMCKGTGCAFEDHDIPLYFDNNHPSLSASPYFAGIIAAQLDEQLGASLQ